MVWWFGGGGKGHKKQWNLLACFSDSKGNLITCILSHFDRRSVWHNSAILFLLGIVSQRGWCSMTSPPAHPSLHYVIYPLSTPRLPSCPLPPAPHNIRKDVEVVRKWEIIPFRNRWPTPLSPPLWGRASGYWCPITLPHFCFFLGGGGYFTDCGDSFILAPASRYGVSHDNSTVGQSHVYFDTNLNYWKYWFIVNLVWGQLWVAILFLCNRMGRK